ncbi:MAG: hypothetical protein ACE5HF_04865 [Gemmatimonadota bacterium]
MTHITDGELEAFLDGETLRSRVDVEGHVRDCQDCRRRLAEARERRRETADLLGGVPRRADPIGFQDVLNRARTGGGTAEIRGSTRSRRFGPLPLAWAATILVSAGAGWFARQAVVRAPVEAPEGYLLRVQTPEEGRVSELDRTAAGAERRRVESESGAPPPAAEKVVAKSREREEAGAADAASGHPGQMRAEEAPMCLRITFEARRGATMADLLAGARELLSDTASGPAARPGVDHRFGEAPTELRLPVPGRLAGGPVSFWRLQARPCEADPGATVP